MKSTSTWSRLSTSTTGATPTIHEGYAARAIEERGGISERCEINREIKRENAERQQARQKLAAKKAELEQELQDENGQLAQQLAQAKGKILTLRAKEQSAAELAAIIKDQQSEITLLKQNNLNLTQQNEKLLGLAQNEKLKSENSVLRQNVQNANSRAESL